MSQKLRATIIVSVGDGLPDVPAAVTVTSCIPCYPLRTSARTGVRALRDMRNPQGQYYPRTALRQIPCLESNRYAARRVQESEPYGICVIRRSDITRTRAQWNKKMPVRICDGSYPSSAYGRTSSYVSEVAGDEKSPLRYANRKNDASHTGLISSYP